MFSPAEIPMWKALRLFDANRHLTLSRFSGVLKGEGWLQASHSGHSEIFIKEGCNLVFKLDESLMNRRGYNRFARRLRQPDVLIATHPHLPRVFRHRDGFTLLERLDFMSEEVAEEWGRNAREMLWLKGHQLSVEDDEPIKEFAQNWPKLESSLDLVLKIAGKNRILIKSEDILQRADGTPVIIDPIV